MSELPTDWMRQLQAAYPKRAGGQGWGHVRKKVPELINDGHSFEELLDSVKRYCALCKALGDERGPFVMQARTFFGPGEWWLEDYDLPTDGSVTLTLNQEAETHGLKRGPDESDESLKRRLGIAQTKAIYSR